LGVPPPAVPWLAVFATGFDALTFKIRVPFVRPTMRHTKVGRAKKMGWKIPPTLFSYRKDEL
jgi:hypothetical protein